MRGVVIRGNSLLLSVLLVAICVLLIGCSSPVMPSPNISITSTPPKIDPTSVPATSIAGISKTPDAEETVSLVPPADPVKAGTDFELDVRIKTKIPSRGFQCIVKWDPAKVKCTGVEEGGFYKDFVKANKINEFVNPQPLTFDNETGKFPAGTDLVGSQLFAAAIALLGSKKNDDGTLIGPSGSGSAFKLHMAANAGAIGTTEFSLEQVKLNNNGQPPITIDAAINNCQITITGP